MSKPTELQTFATMEEAIAWMVVEVDDPFIDNERFAFEDDAEACAEYVKQVLSGGCARFDEIVIVAGRLANVGCNYGY